jgi:hypothetical protein
MKNFATILVILTISACQSESQSPAQGDWITGTPQNQIETIEKQFRGFDMAMVETGYRYQELYWAGQDQNWEHANYQLKKIKKAITNGLERRPKRASSATNFLNVTLLEMEKAIQTQDTTMFKTNFQQLTISCNNCHKMEKLAFFSVKEPVVRTSPIRK